MSFKVLFKSLMRLISVGGMAIVLASVWLSAEADDTELFTAGNIGNSQRPQVMILLDTSGSMRYEAPKATYNSAVTYDGRFEPLVIYEISYDYKDELLVSGSPCVRVGKKGNRRIECPGNYLNWYEQPVSTKISLARQAIRDLINDNPNVDFGLSAFIGGDYAGSGGYIRHRISPDGSDILNDLNNLTPDGGTPLCGAYYEVLNFFTGRNVYKANLTNSRDKTLESIVGKQYKTTDQYGDTPVVKPCQNLYIIYVTDGEPSTEDTVNSVVLKDKRLKINGEDRITRCDRYEKNNGNMDENCLPKLAEYLANPGPGGLDDNSVTGNQKAFTYTIGFATDQVLLKDTADKGNGVCYTTVGSNTDSTTGCVVVNDIASAFQGALGEILQQTSTFVSPALAVNSFNRTESLDNAYYAMFLPSESSRWTGNLKKLKVYKNSNTAGCTSNDVHTSGTVVDRGCDAALDDGSNRIADGRSTYWGTVNDGSNVTSGGLGAALLNARGTFYTNLINQLGTEYLGPVANINTRLFNLDGTEDYTAANLINWIQGLDNDGNTLDWVLGDILHSRPVTLNYGDRDGDDTAYSETNPDIRLVFGTNYP